MDNGCTLATRLQVWMPSARAGACCCNAHQWRPYHPRRCAPVPAADATLKPCRARRRGDGATKRGRCCHCFLLSLATLAALAGAGLFIAGAILQVQNPGLAL